jgi:hypothetical protein
MQGKSKAIMTSSDWVWPFPIHNGERTEASKLLLVKDRNPDKTEGDFYYDLESAVYYVYPIDTNEEKEAPF